MKRQIIFIFLLFMGCDSSHAGKEKNITKKQETIAKKKLRKKEDGDLNLGMRKDNSSDNSPIVLNRPSRFREFFINKGEFKIKNKNKIEEDDSEEKKYPSIRFYKEYFKKKVIILLHDLENIANNKKFSFEELKSALLKVINNKIFSNSLIYQILNYSKNNLSKKIEKLENKYNIFDFIENMKKNIYNYNHIKENTEKALEIYKEFFNISVECIKEPLSINSENSFQYCKEKNIPFSIFYQKIQYNIEAFLNKNTEKKIFDEKKFIENFIESFLKPIKRKINKEENTNIKKRKCHKAYCKKSYNREYYIDFVKNLEDCIENNGTLSIEKLKNNSINCINNSNFSDQQLYAICGIYKNSLLNKIKKLNKNDEIYDLINPIIQCFKAYDDLKHNPERALEIYRNFINNSQYIETIFRLKNKNTSNLKIFYTYCNNHFIPNGLLRHMLESVTKKIFKENPKIDKKELKKEILKEVGKRIKKNQYKISNAEDNIIPELRALIKNKEIIINENLRKIIFKFTKIKLKNKEKNKNVEDVIQVLENTIHKVPNKYLELIQLIIEEKGIFENFCFKNLILKNKVQYYCLNNTLNELSAKFFMKNNSEYKERSKVNLTTIKTHFEKLTKKEQEKYKTDLLSFVKKYFYEKYPQLNDEKDLFYPAKDQRILKAYKN